MFKNFDLEDSAHQELDKELLDGMDEEEILELLQKDWEKGYGQGIKVNTDPKTWTPEQQKIHKELTEEE